MCTEGAPPQVCASFPSSSHCPELSSFPALLPSRLQLLYWGSFKTDDTVRVETIPVMAPEPGTVPGTQKKLAKSLGCM